MSSLTCMGDSLTQGADIPVGQCWPTLVANQLGLEVANCGIGGDTSAGMLARFYAQVLTPKPQFVFILAGTNDLWWGWPLNIILGNLFSLVVQARHHGIAPLLGVPPPVNVAAAQACDFAPPEKGYARLTSNLADLADRLVRHANESEVPIVDLYHPFFENRQIVRQDLFLPDGLHPNTRGHLTIARAVVASMRENFHFAGKRS